MPPIRMCLQYIHAAVFRSLFSIRTFRLFFGVSREFLISLFAHLDSANGGIVGEHPFILDQKKTHELSLPDVNAQRFIYCRYSNDLFPFCMHGNSAVGALLGIRNTP